MLTVELHVLLNLLFYPHTRPPTKLNASPFQVTVGTSNIAFLDLFTDCSPRHRRSHHVGDRVLLGERFFVIKLKSADILFTTVDTWISMEKLHDLLAKLNDNTRISRFRLIHIGLLVAVVVVSNVLTLTIVAVFVCVGLTSVDRLSELGTWLISVTLGANRHCTTISLNLRSACLAGVTGLEPANLFIRSEALYPLSYTPLRENRHTGRGVHAPLTSHAPYALLDLNQ